MYIILCGIFEDQYTFVNKLEKTLWLIISDMYVVVTFQYEYNTLVITRAKEKLRTPIITDLYLTYQITSSLLAV